jgi:D-beta-D-heptose 7-phosphate kinase/D-beta-D-heptose 1-phosphate adenosyltransferase
MKTVFVNGTFDVLHRGHLMLLKYAKSQGTKLIVAIDTDERIKEKKGDSRPINVESERMFMLQHLNMVDLVLSFGTDKQLEDLIKKINPDVMVVGSDWKGKPVIGSQYAKTLKFFDRIDGYSSTKIIQSIADR